MSDLYDSLEDDSDENKCSVSSTSSSEPSKTDSSGSLGGSCMTQPTERYSFFLNTNANAERPALLPIFQQFNNGVPEKKIIFPKIISSCNIQGPNTVQPVPHIVQRVPSIAPSVSNIVVDNKSLLEKGLQFNDDGSFTKSPRQETEELPFITREYRNLQFQKKKTYAMNQKVPENKNRFRLASSVQASKNQTRKKNGPKEEVPTRECSFSPKAIRSKSGKQSVSQSNHNPNMTDSMKERLLQTSVGNQSNNSKRGSLRREKREIKVLEGSDGSKQNKTSPSRRRKSEAGKPQDWSPREKLLPIDKKEAKNPQKISKYKSDIMLTASKSRLNYWERHQMESGFNPFFLRQEYKRVPDDTNRSNFGDSVMEDLSEVSCRVLSCNNLANEEEEMFYKELMRRDKTLKQTQRSSRSEGPLELLQRMNFYKDQKETVSGRSNLKGKNFKSMYIDMPSEGNRSVNTSKKCSHYCQTTPSPKLTKVELALKAKTYGYLVNARNIFRLKAQSEEKHSGAEVEKNEKNVEEMLESGKGSPEASGRLIKQNSLPVNGFTRAKPWSLRKDQGSPRASASWSKEKQRTFKGSQKGFVLPQVHGPPAKGGQISKRLFKEIDSYLASPNN